MYSLVIHFKQFSKKYLAKPPSQISTKSELYNILAGIMIFRIENYISRCSYSHVSVRIYRKQHVSKRNYEITTVNLSIKVPVFLYSAGIHKAALFTNIGNFTYRDSMHSYVTYSK